MHKECKKTYYTVKIYLKLTNKKAYIMVYLFQDSLRPDEKEAIDVVWLKNAISFPLSKELKLIIQILSTLVHERLECDPTPQF